jgi:hypothetical protein
MPSSNNPQTSTQAVVAERMAQLPKIVQDAIRSADVEKHLRLLADGHKLHLDQWGILENEVMLTLMGFQEIRDLQSNIEKEVGVSTEIAAELASDISKTVFEPIRQELERQLEKPDAAAAKVSPEEKARQQILANGESAPGSAAPIPPTQPINTPATPPTPPQTEKAVRTQISPSYAAKESSTERKEVAGDPYRETPL